MEVKSFDLIQQQGVVQKIINDKENSSFFVLNNTDRPTQGRSTKQAGTLLISVKVEGDARIVRIPVSWVPIDVSAQAPKEYIGKSAEFLRALSLGTIMVLTHAEAHKIINADSDSKLEYARIMAIAQGVNGADEAAGSNNKDGAEAVFDPWANVSQEVRLNVEELNNETMSENEFRSFVRRSERSISPLDRKYIVAQAPDVAAKLGIRE